MSVDAATATVFSPVIGGEDRLKSQDAGGEDDHQHGGHQGIADGPADDAVDVEESVAQHGETDGDGHEREGDDGGDPDEAARPQRRQHCGHQETSDDCGDDRADG